jgi:hypothetical protein
MMADVTPGCPTTNATARWMSDTPASAATLTSSSTAASLAALPGSDGSNRCGIRCARSVLMSTLDAPLIRPVSQPPLSGLHAITPMP